MAQELKFLIVDDFALVRTMIKQVLADFGYKNFFEASSGTDAMQRIRDAHASGAPFDYVFIDWKMPQVSGFDVIKTCKEDKNFSNIHFIMVSAEQDAGSVHDALKAGAADYITKPFSIPTLAKKIEKILNKNKKSA